MEELILIFKKIKEEFCSLWNFKERGATLEIITPFTTTSNKFISIFFTARKNEFVISDGGWLESGVYETALNFEDDSFSKIFSYYQDHFNIKVIETNDVDFYYKKTKEKKEIPSLVYDLANFVSTVASISQIQLTDIKEKEEKTRFNKQANDYLSSLFVKNNKNRSIKFMRPLGDQLKSIRFSAIANNDNKLSLINYVTGSTVEYFIGSIGKANIMFEVADNSPFREVIKNRIALINDIADGFSKPKLYNYLDRLSSTTGGSSIFWHEKEKIKELI